jgi:hypothetical protein
VDSSVSKGTRLTRGTTIGRIVFLLWVLTVTGVCTRVALTRTPGRQDVFPVYQNAGRCWLAGHDLYHHAKFDYRYCLGIAGWFGGMKRFGIYFSPLALSALLLAAYLLRPAIFRRMNAVASARIPTDHQLA